MNPFWFFRNLRRAWRVCPTWRDRFHLLRLTYSAKLPAWAKAPEGRPLSLHYPAPIGDLTVIMRANNGSDAFVLGEVFDLRYYDFRLSISTETILDLGANAGYTAIFFARKYPEAQIACVEPMRQNLEILKRNLSLNEIRADVFAAAISVKDGPIQMETNVNDYGHKVVDSSTAFSGQLVSCEGISMPSLMQKLAWKRIGLLKIDIEGYEQVLLKENCDWLNQVDAICIECHEGYSEADLNELAEKYEFTPPQRMPGVWLLTSRKSL